MSAYKIPIEVAFLVFPFVAFLLTLPFLIYHYRKYGAIPFLRSTIFYSLILYLLAAYFLIILPLPTTNFVENLTTPTMQLVPFQFLKDILQGTSFQVTDFATYWPSLKNATVYTVLFNILLTLPFGIYLRYYFRKKWYQVILYTFGLSLFFELTQLSGLYGIYPRPYRLFDVDDLIVNTLGGIIGFLITPIFQKILPTRQQLDASSYQKGEKVTLLRRITAFLIDIFFLTILIVMIKIGTHNTFLEEYSYLFSLVGYFIILPLLTKGQTIGKKILNLKIASMTGSLKWYQLLFRNIMLIFLTLFPSVWLNSVKQWNHSEGWHKFLFKITIMIGVYQLLNILYYIITIKKERHHFLYEKITKTENISTILIPPEKKVEKEEAENEIEEKKQNKSQESKKDAL